MSAHLDHQREGQISVLGTQMDAQAAQRRPGFRDGKMLKRERERSPGDAMCNERIKCHKVATPGSLTCTHRVTRRRTQKKQRSGTRMPYDLQSLVRPTFCPGDRLGGEGVTSVPKCDSPLGAARSPTPLTLACIFPALELRV